MFHTSSDDKVLPVRPVVFIAETDTKDEARRIHQKLWNLGIAPFLMVLLPDQIRIYTGFDYSHKKEKIGLIEDIKFSDTNLTNKLKSFSADSIDSGEIWKAQAKNLDPEKRVDVHLLNNLKKLEERLIEKNIDLATGHSLIGKYIYIRYLSDRGILSQQWLEENNLDLDLILSRNATLKHLCLIIESLENKFNGSIFPFPENAKNVLTDQIVSLVASVFKGDDPMSGQLHLDFEPYDFSLIPIEILSSIYEQFLHAYGTGKKVGAIYTPEPVADYLLCEINSVKSLRKGMKILDPCCGSGIFLVLTYRRLIEMEVTKAPNKKLDTTKLTEILLESIYGVERNQDACYVAEFSLILTMLNYIDLTDLHKNKEFRFPLLHNVRIYEADFFDDESNFWKNDIRFDWVVGNPPWIGPKPNDETEKLAVNWINKNTKTRPVSSNRISEAVSWRVTDIIKDDGCVGLLNHATTLFNRTAERYRKEFFTKNTVFRITNFSNLAFVLFHKKSTVPSSTIIYKKSKQDEEKPDILHYSPFLMNQLPTRFWKEAENQVAWVIVVNASEIESVNPKEAERGTSLIWKLALWGNYRDKKAINKLQKLFKSTLEEFDDDKKGRKLCRGLDLKDNSKPQEVDYLPDITGQKLFDANLIDNYCFSIPEMAFSFISQEKSYVRKRSGKEGLTIIRSPHVIVNPEYCIFSEQDFIIPDSQIGISANKEEEDLLRALSVFLSSNIVRYYLFFYSASWGVSRSKINPKDIKNIPIPKFTEAQIKELANLQQQLAEMEISGTYSRSELQMILDKKIESILMLPKSLSILANDFINIKLTLNTGNRAVTPATKMPSEMDLLVYGECLRAELDDFIGDKETHHKIFIWYSKHLIICTVEILYSKMAMDISIAQINQDSTKFQEISEKLKQKFSQWIYIQRSLLIVKESIVYIFRSPQLINWTRSQALKDSDDIIAEVLTNSVSSEVAS